MGDRDHPGIAATLHELGAVSRKAGDLKQAKQHYDESLRMKRSLHGDRDHPDIAAMLHSLGFVSGQAGDLKQAKQHYDESLRMERSLYGDRDHPGIAATLHELGTEPTGWRPQASEAALWWVLANEALLVWGQDHPGIAATLHELGAVSQQAGDLKQAKQHYDESLRMNGSLHVDTMTLLQNVDV